MINNFYIKVWVKAFLCYCLSYSFFITNLIWGDHEWKFLKTGVKISDGFFESRYSQHSLTQFLLDGHIIPIITFLLTLAILCVLSILIANYLDFPKEEKVYLLIALFIGLNPHNFVYFYYLFISMPIFFWATLSILALKLLDYKTNWYKIIGAIVLLIAIFGGYIPVITLAFILFIVKHLNNLALKKENLKQFIISGIIFFLVISLSYLIYDMINEHLKLKGLVNTNMYNMKLKNFIAIFKSMPIEFYKSLIQTIKPHPFMEDSYNIILSILVFSGFMLFVYKNIKSPILILGICLLLLVSRFIFIIAENAYRAELRLLYWSQLGIYTLALSILFSVKSKIFRNIIYIWFVFCFVLFFKINFDVQKNWNLGFHSEVKYRDRVLTSVIDNNNFNMDKLYITFNFGQPHFRLNFYNKNNAINRYKYLYKMDTAEMLGKDLGFDGQIMDYLFWDFIKSPIYKVPDNFFNDYLTLAAMNKDNSLINNAYGLKKWISSNPKTYPHKDSIYIDCISIVLNLEYLYFQDFQSRAFNMLNVD